MTFDHRCGYLFFWVVPGIDPGPIRAAYPIRPLILLIAMAFHAFFGVAVKADQQILAADWWASIGYTATATLLDDQADGSSIAWGAGEPPDLIARSSSPSNGPADDESHRPPPRPPSRPRRRRRSHRPQRPPREEGLVATPRDAEPTFLGRRRTWLCDVRETVVSMACQSRSGGYQRTGAEGSPLPRATRC
ncbi:cytochrome c oxidase assembly protein [Cellulosimicrobium funkei]|uniref:cytochrome c oxidase assembly protein n=1 Tax=Cellulosimicrobium funkei TaxID=264251 RepID=UPI003D727A9D